jgi:hypothetical protein
VDAGLKAGDLPGVVRTSLLLVWPGEEQVPAGVECVDFEFEVVQAVAGGVQKNLEVVVVEYDGVMSGQGGPDVRLD